MDIWQLLIGIKCKCFQNLKFCIFNLLFIDQFSFLRELCSSKLWRIATLFYVKESHCSPLKRKRRIEDLRSKEYARSSKKQKFLKSKFMNGMKFKVFVNVNHGHRHQKLIAPYNLDKFYYECVEFCKLLAFLCLIEP